MPLPLQPNQPCFTNFIHEPIIEWQQKPSCPSIWTVQNTFTLHQNYSQNYVRTCRKVNWTWWSIDVIFSTFSTYGQTWWAIRKWLKWPKHGLISNLTILITCPSTRPLHFHGGGRRWGGGTEGVWRRCMDGQEEMGAGHERQNGVVADVRRATERRRRANTRTCSTFHRPTYTQLSW